LGLLQQFWDTRIERFRWSLLYRQHVVSIIGDMLPPHGAIFCVLLGLIFAKGDVITEGAGRVEKVQVWYIVAASTVDATEGGIRHQGGVDSLAVCLLLIFIPEQVFA